MGNIPKIVGIICCGFLFSVTLYASAMAEHSPSPSDNMKSDSLTQGKTFQSDDDRQRNLKIKRSSAKGERTIRGELFLVEDGHYFVKEKDGEEVRLHTDKTTKMIGTVMKNDYVEAKVNNKNHALSIRSIDQP